MVALAVPVAATQLSGMLMGLIDTLMLGRVSVEALGAASIANVWLWGMTMFANGVLFGLDPIFSQAHGARDRQRLGVALQRGLVLAVLISVPLIWLVLQTGSVLLLFGQDPGLSADAQAYSLARIPGLPFYMVYSVLRQYLQGRELVRPALWVILIANAVNIFLNWILIFGHLGFPAYGLIGAGVATSLTQVLSLVGLYLFVRAFSLHRGAWVGWSRKAVDPKGLREIIRLGFPIAIQVSLEMWAFSLGTLIAGMLGPVHLVAHTVAINMASITFMLPLGVAQAATTRVGNLIGAGKPLDAQRAAWVSMAMGAGIMAVLGTVMVLLRDFLPRLYTSDLEVVMLCASVLPIAALFQVFDGAQVVACGVLRGMGRVRPAMVFNLISYWLIGLPLGGYLALRTNWGLVGLWWGLCIGLILVASSLVVWIRLRGPASESGAVELTS
ncbi:MAG: MATE family efflux transporter [bacterium]|nr:MATE family efflux transporter [bacterium]